MAVKPPPGKIAKKGVVRLGFAPNLAVQKVLATQRAQLMGVIELRGVNRLRKSYAVAQGQLRDKLRAITLAGRGQSFTAHHLGMVLAQVTDGLKFFQQALDKNLRDAGKLAQALAPRHLVEAAQKLEKVYAGHAPVLHVEQAAVFRNVMRKAEPILLERYAQSMQYYGVPVVNKVREEMALSLLQGETVDEAVDRVDDVIGEQRWRAERIVRTELSHSYGVTQQVAMVEMRNDMPGMQKKLIETFDDRTGEDSKELHGQVQDVDKPFIWNKVTKKGIEIVEYMMPPNRPNDRAVVIPWMPSWEDTPETVEGGEGPGDVRPRQPPASVVEEAAKA